MNNHYYTYDNVIRKQSKRGAIGNKLTEKLGRLLMKRHYKKYLKLLRKVKLEHELFEHFVDDETEGLAAVEPGVRIVGDKLVRNKALVELDKDIPEDERTFNLLKEIGDSIYPCVEFTVDVPSFHLDGRLPVLDLVHEVNNDQFEHGFYEKPCSSEVVIPYSSAHSRKMKMSVMVEEGVRR